MSQRIACQYPLLVEEITDTFPPGPVPAGFSRLMAAPLVVVRFSAFSLRTGFHLLGHSIYIAKRTSVHHLSTASSALRLDFLVEFARLA